MKKYEYKNLHIKNKKWSRLNNVFSNPENILDQNALVDTLNEWGDSNWELIDLDIGTTKSIAFSSSVLFFLFKRELNDDLTPNKNNKYEYRVVFERTSNPFTDDEQNKYFSEWVKEGFDLVKNINIKLEANVNGNLYFPLIVYIFKKQIWD